MLFIKCQSVLPIFTADQHKALAQVLPGLGFVRRSYCLIAYGPFKAKKVSNIFQDPVENTCAFLVEALCHRSDDLKISASSIM